MKNSFHSICLWEPASSWLERKSTQRSKKRDVQRKWQARYFWKKKISPFFFLLSQSNVRFASCMQKKSINFRIPWDSMSSMSEPERERERAHNNDRVDNKEEKRWVNASRVEGGKSWAERRLGKHFFVFVNSQFKLAPFSPCSTDRKAFVIHFLSFLTTFLLLSIAFRFSSLCSLSLVQSSTTQQIRFACERDGVKNRKIFSFHFFFLLLLWVPAETPLQSS